MLEKIISGIQKTDKKDLTKKEWDSIAHPIGSLGELENMTIKLGNIEGKAIPSIEKRVLICMAGDNGIFDEGVSSGYSDLTSQLFLSMARGKTGCATMCKDANTQLVVVDLGTRREIVSEKLSEVIIEKRRINSSTKNFALEPAMTNDEMMRAISAGFEMVDKYDADIYGTGEIGIANTTTSSAVMAAMFKLPAEFCVGLGGGIDDEGLRKKINVIDEAIKKYNLHDKTPLEILQTVGGYDIAGLVGVFLKAAYNKRAVVVDGFISAVAASVAVSLNENVRDYLLASHLSSERQMLHLLEFLNLKAGLDLSMRLGEGTGCPLLFKILDTAIYALKNMGRWDDVKITDSLFNIRKDE